MESLSVATIRSREFVFFTGRKCKMLRALRKKSLFSDKFLIHLHNYCTSSKFEQFLSTETPPLVTNSQRIVLLYTERH